MNSVGITSQILLKNKKMGSNHKRPHRFLKKNSRVGNRVMLMNKEIKKSFNLSKNLELKTRKIIRISPKPRKNQKKTMIRNNRHICRNSKKSMNKCNQYLRHKLFPSKKKTQKLKTMEGKGGIEHIRKTIISPIKISITVGTITIIIKTLETATDITMIGVGKIKIITNKRNTKLGRRAMIHH